jgi:hypothetical protein
VSWLTPKDAVAEIKKSAPAKIDQKSGSFEELRSNSFDAFEDLGNSAEKSRLTALNLPP